MSIYYIEVSDPFATLVGPFPAPANAEYYINNHVGVQGGIIELPDPGTGGLLPPDVDLSRQLTPEDFWNELLAGPPDDPSVDRFLRAIQRGTP